ncbi:YhcN/YlaJ family sporulation lipoprotein [Oceanobacillus sp. CAU 1775]
MHIRKLGFFLFVLFFLVGCQQTDNTSTNQGEQSDNNRFMQVENTAERGEAAYSNSEIAQHLANVASKVPDVNNASALVAGPYTVVAIDLEEDVDRGRAGSIKYTVSEALYHDPYGKSAIVVADADFMARINGMNEKMRQGQPVQGIIEELAAIVGRYMPEYPVPDDEQIGNDEKMDDAMEDGNESLNEAQQTNE